MKILMTFLVAVTLSACTSSTVIRTGQAYAPISPDQVQVFFEPPYDYQVLGLVDAHSDIVFSSHKAEKRAIKRLVEEAAALGANGVLITFEADYATQSLDINSDQPFNKVDVDFTHLVKAEAILVAPAMAAN